MGAERRRDRPRAMRENIPHLAKNSKPFREIRLRLIERERVGEFEIVRALDHVHVAFNDGIPMKVRIVAGLADKHSSARCVTAHPTYASSERLHTDISHLALPDHGDAPGYWGTMPVSSQDSESTYIAKPRIPNGERAQIGCAAAHEFWNRRARQGARLSHDLGVG